MIEFNWLRHSFENGPEGGTNCLHGLMNLFFYEEPSPRYLSSGWCICNRTTCC